MINSHQSQYKFLKSVKYTIKMLLVDDQRVVQYQFQQSNKVDLQAAKPANAKLQFNFSVLETKNG